MDNNRLRTAFVCTLVVMSVYLLSGVNSCRNIPDDPGRQYANKPPDTRLANLPVNDSTGEYIHLGRKRYSGSEMMRMVLSLRTVFAGSIVRTWV
jgi:hypothetical protein